MALNTGTLVQAPVRPYDSQDAYPTHESRFGKGGWREVATLAERDAITADRKSAGMAVFVTAEQVLYLLNLDLTTWTAFNLSFSPVGVGVTEEFTVAAGTNSIMLANSFSTGVILGVYINGLKQQTTDFTATAPRTITFSEPILTNNTKIKVEFGIAQSLTQLMASSVNVNDTGGFYLSSTVEGVLQEVGADIVQAQADIDALQAAPTAAALRADLANPANGFGGDLVATQQPLSGAIVRNAQDKFEESFSVKDFGALGNGIAIDRAAIQLAVDTLNARFVATGKEQELEIPEGVYMVDAVNYLTDAGAVLGITSIKLRDGVHIRGKGTIKVINGAYGGGAFYRCFSSRDATRLSNASVRGITVDGNRANQVASVQANNFLLTANTNVTVDSVRCINANGSGIQITGAVGSNATNIQITNNNVLGCNTIGIQCSQFDRLTISGNVVDDCTDNCVDVYGENGTTVAGGGQNFVISDNRLIRGLVGIFLETVQIGQVTGNVVTACSFGFTSNRINGVPRELNVVGNTFSNCVIGGRISGDTEGIAVRANCFSAYSSRGLQIGIAAGNVSYVDASDNLFIPNNNTLPTIQIGDVDALTNSFITGRNNTVVSNGISQALLTTFAGGANVGVSVGGYRVLPNQVGPDVEALDLRANRSQSITHVNLNGTAQDTAGPVDIPMESLTAGILTVTAVQGGVGRVFKEIPYIFTGGVITLGTIRNLVVTADPIVSVVVNGSNIRLNLVAANTFLRWGIVLTPIQS